MMNNLIKNIQSMYDEQMYSSSARLCSLALSAMEQKSENVSTLDRLTITTIYADSLFHTHQYSQAEQIYREALQTKKFLLKSKIIENQTDHTTDAELKYKIYQCLSALKQPTPALTILQSVLPRHRNAKINMALANLYKEAGMARSAVNCYKEVLRESPLSLDAAENLLKFGVKGVEINAIMIDYTSEVGWLNQWLKAQAQFYALDFGSAIQTFAALDSHGLLKNNTILLVNMGYCYHLMSETEKAISVLQRAMKLDSNLTFGRDLLATLCATSENSEHVKYLESICPTSETILWGAEDWVCLGNYMLATKKHDKAVYFAQQALDIAGSNIEALLLRARTNLRLNEALDGAQYCKEAILLCPYRYDLHQTAVECYMKLNRFREAETMAQNACKELNNSLQALTLHASVLLKDPMTSSKSVMKLLEKIVGQDKNGSTKAVCMLVKFLVQEQQFEQAKQLLLKFIEQFPSAKMHQMLADCYVNLQKDEDAFHHYNVALKLDPGNQKAMEGLSCIGHTHSASKRESYYTCVGESSQGTSASDADGNEGSDADAWPIENSFS